MAYLVGVIPGASSGSNAVFSGLRSYAQDGDLVVLISALYFGNPQNPASPIIYVAPPPSGGTYQNKGWHYLYQGFGIVVGDEGEGTNGYLTWTMFCAYVTDALPDSLTVGHTNAYSHGPVLCVALIVRGLTPTAADDLGAESTPTHPIQRRDLASGWSAYATTQASTDPASGWYDPPWGGDTDPGKFIVAFHAYYGAAPLRAPLIDYHPPDQPSGEDYINQAGEPDFRTFEKVPGTPETTWPVVYEREQTQLAAPYDQYQYLQVFSNERYRTPSAWKYGLRVYAGPDPRPTLGWWSAYLRNVGAYHIDGHEGYSSADQVVTIMKFADVSFLLTTTSCLDGRLTVEGQRSPTTGRYRGGSTVRIKAEAAPGFVFSHWIVDGVARAPEASPNPLTLLMDTDHTVESVCVPGTPPFFYIEVIDSEGCIASPGSGSYPAGSVLGLTATALEGYVFDHWQVDGVAVGAANPYNLTVDADHTVKAVCALGGPQITTTTLPSASVGAPYAAAFAAVGGLLPYTWTSAGALAPGLSFSGGAVSGDPALAGTYPFTVRVTDANGLFDEGVFVIAVRPRLQILPTLLANAQVAVAYSATLQALGGIPPYRWSISRASLPPELSIGPVTGVIAGVPSTPGRYPFTAMVTDSVGGTDAAELSITVTTGLPLRVVTGSLTATQVGVTYSATLAAEGGTPPYTWSLAAGGSPPPGLSLTAGGVLSGTPSAPGDYVFTVQVSDVGNPLATAQGTLLLRVVGVLVIVTPDLPNGVLGAPYTATLEATGGTPSYSWTQVAGQLPPGLTLNSATGVLGGVPEALGSFSFTVQVTDGYLTTAVRAYQVMITSGPALVITTLTLPSAQPNAPYSATVAASGGIVPYAWSISAGATPNLTINQATGELAGTPTVAGTYRFTVQVADTPPAPGQPFATHAREFTLNVGVIVRGLRVNIPLDVNLRRAGEPQARLLQVEAPCSVRSGNKAPVVRALFLPDAYSQPAYAGDAAARVQLFGGRRKITLSGSVSYTTGAARAILTWTHPGAIQGEQYNVEVMQPGSVTYFTISSYPGVSGTTFTDTGLGVAGTYRYRVRAINVADISNGITLQAEAISLTLTASYVGGVWQLYATWTGPAGSYTVAAKTQEATTWTTVATGVTSFSWNAAAGTYRCVRVTHDATGLRNPYDMCIVLDPALAGPGTSLTGAWFSLANASISDTPAGSEVLLRLTLALDQTWVGRIVNLRVAPLAGVELVGLESADESGGYDFELSVQNGILSGYVSASDSSVTAAIVVRARVAVTPGGGVARLSGRATLRNYNGTDSNIGYQAEYSLPITGVAQALERFLVAGAEALARLTHVGGAATTAVAKQAENTSGAPITQVPAGQVMRWRVTVSSNQPTAQLSFQVIDTFPTGMQGISIVSATRFRSAAISSRGFSAVAVPISGQPAVFVIQVGVLPTVPAGAVLTNTVTVDPNGAASVGTATITVGGV